MATYLTLSSLLRARRAFLRDEPTPYSVIIMHWTVVRPVRLPACRAVQPSIQTQHPHVHAARAGHDLRHVDDG
jgi:hypothetical protein